jgi:hypothetical protein
MYFIDNKSTVKNEIFKLQDYSCHISKKISFCFLGDYLKNVCKREKLIQLKNSDARIYGLTEPTASLLASHKLKKASGRL